MKRSEFIKALLAQPGHDPEVLCMQSSCGEDYGRCHDPHLAIIPVNWCSGEFGIASQADGPGEKQAIHIS